MRTAVVLTFVVAAFAAVFAAPSAPKVSVQKINISPIAYHAKTLSAPKDFVGDLVQLIGQMYGLDVAAIRYEIEELAQAIQVEIPIALNTIVAEAGQVDDKLAERYKDLLTKAIDEAVGISQRLVDVIAKLIAILPQSTAVNAVSPKNLIDDLLVIVVGLTQAQLEDLVNETLASLSELITRVVVEVQNIATSVSAELSQAVNAAIANAEAKILKELVELYNELSPILGV